MQVQYLHQCRNLSLSFHYSIFSPIHQTCSPHLWTLKGYNPHTNLLNSLVTAPWQILKCLAQTLIYHWLTPLTPMTNLSLFWRYLLNHLDYLSCLFSSWLPLSISLYHSLERWRQIPILKVLACWRYFCQILIYQGYQRDHSQYQSIIFDSNWLVLDLRILVVHEPT